MELIAAAFFSLTLNMGLNLYLMPRYSYMGAAWATVASEAFAFVVIYLLARRVPGLRLGVRLVIRLAIPTSLAAAMVLLLHAVAPVAIVAGALAAFLVGVVAARVVTQADIGLVLGRLEACRGRDRQDVVYAAAVLVEMPRSLNRVCMSRRRVS